MVVMTVCHIGMNSEERRTLCLLILSNLEMTDLIMQALENQQRSNNNWKETGGPEGIFFPHRKEGSGTYHPGQKFRSF